ncbi:HAD family hydrolase, partial [uncultured Dubosiella sp.]
DGFISDSAGTVVYVARGEKLLGAIEVADGLKEDSVAAIGALKAQGVKTVMLTGDNRTAAARVAAEAGVDEYRAELLPDMKVTELETV